MDTIDLSAPLVWGSTEWDVGAAWRGWWNDARETRWQRRNGHIGVRGAVVIDTFRDAVRVREIAGLAHRRRRNVLVWTVGVVAGVLGTSAAVWIFDRLGPSADVALWLIPGGAVAGVYYLGGAPKDDVIVYEAP